jgi:putative tryptophan/tyrosine transport system substrate-binding protein
MRRREFITLLGGAMAAAAPLRAHAQQAGKPRLIAVAAGFTEEEMKPLLEAMLAQLRVHGWTVGNNIALEARYASGAYGAEQVRALIANKPDVIVTQGTGMLTVVRKETQSIPTVFTMVPDPVKLGIVSNMARPGGNLTGFTNFEFSIAGKWLELLKELKPSLKRVVQIANLDNPNNTQFAKYIEGEGKTFGLDVATVGVRSAGEIVPGIMATTPSPDTAIVVLPDSLLVINRKLIGDLAATHRMPAMYPFRIFTEEGGLISYGLNFTELYQQTATYIDRILKGEKPGDLPIQAPTKFELIINTKVAKSIGITVPPQLLARADDVIE